jgi:hypothetical protein
MSLDQTKESGGKREQLAEPSPTRNAAKPDKVRKNMPVEPIDQDRLMKAIRYLREHPRAKRSISVDKLTSS